MFRSFKKLFALGKSKKTKLYQRARLLRQSVCRITVGKAGLPSIGGGVCVAIRKGHILVASAFHVVDGVKDDNITIRFHGGRAFPALIVAPYPLFDLVLLRISTVNEEDTSMIRSVYLPWAISLVRDESMICFSHSMNAFSMSLGRVALPFPDDASFPNLSSTLPPEAYDPEARQGYIHVFLAKHDSDSIFLAMHPNIPLIKVHGQCGESGGSGCPIFQANTRNVCAGLLLYGHQVNGTTFLPSPMIRRAVDHYYEMNDNM